MDRKDGKKKESIDEILSDLNGLLNRMPSILDGIKMPEIKPAEFSKPEPAPVVKKAEPEPLLEPVEGKKPGVPEAEKTIVLEAFPGGPEGAASPEEKTAESPAPDAGDKTMIIEGFSGLPEGAPVPEAEKLVPQSLGDFMFGEGAQEQKAEPERPVKLFGAPLEPPAEQPAKEPSAAEKPKLSISEFAPPPDKEPAAELPPPVIDSPAIEPETPAAVPAEPVRPVAGLAGPHAYDTTRDFGIPDIDALMKLSDGDLKSPVGPEPFPEPAPAPEPEKVEPSMDELAEFEKQIKAAVPRVDAMENKPEEEKPEIQQAPEAAPAPAGEPEGLVLEPSSKPEAGEGLITEPQDQPAQESAEALQPEPFGAVNAAPQEAVLEVPQPEAAPAAGGIELSPGQADETLSAGRPEPGPALESFGAAIPGAQSPSGGESSSVQHETGQDSSPLMPVSGDETLVVPPPVGGGAGEEEKTVIFEAGAARGVTPLAQAGDLAGLAEKAVPDGIPAERVRSVVFLYSAEDKALCATVLSELDSICLKSATKPMFIKRASVRECAPDMNANYIAQIVADAGGQGLVCVGAIPQEKIYEIESAFNASGGFSRHYDSASFNYSAALDLVSDLILR